MMRLYGALTSIAARSLALKLPPVRIGQEYCQALSITCTAIWIAHRCQMHGLILPLIHLRDRSANQYNGKPSCWRGHAYDWVPGLGSRPQSVEHC